MGKEEEKIAVAIQYEPEEIAPRIVATGKGYLADKITNVAKEESIPIHQDSSLATTLSKLQLNDYIPKELYDVVAKILVYVDACDRYQEQLFEK